jgi:hypothetical protein
MQDANSIRFNRNVTYDAQRAAPNIATPEFI